MQSFGSETRNQEDKDIAIVKGVMDDVDGKEITTEKVHEQEQRLKQQCWNVAQYWQDEKERMGSQQVQNQEVFSLVPTTSRLKREDGSEDRDQSI